MTKTIMIVGNGEIDPECAGQIDGADLVIRFNLCASVGNGGSKTDMIAVCNTGRPAKAMLESETWKNSAATRQASEICCVRDSARFAGLRGHLKSSHPELDDFCDDYTEGYRQFAVSTGKAFRAVPSSVHDDVDRDLAAFSPPPYVVPSSGLIVIFDVLSRFEQGNARIVLAGFGHHGWQWHPFATERLLVEQLVAQGTLSRIHNLQPISQGA